MLDQHWINIASVAVTRESCEAITAIQEYIEGLQGLLSESGNALVPYLEEKVVGSVTIPNRALQVYNKIAAFRAQL